MALPQRAQLISVGVRVIQSVSRIKEELAKQAFIEINDVCKLISQSSHDRVRALTHSTTAVLFMKSFLTKSTYWNRCGKQLPRSDWSTRKFGNNLLVAIRLRDGGPSLLSNKKAADFKKSSIAHHSGTSTPHALCHAVAASLHTARLHVNRHLFGFCCQTKDAPCCAPSVYHIFLIEQE